MTLAGANQFKAGIDKMIAALNPGDVMILYMQGWKADIDANVSNAASLVAGEGIMGEIVYTFALLPSAAANSGMEAIVTDATTPTVGSTVAGGGAVRVMVKSNGTNWIVE